MRFLLIFTLLAALIQGCSTYDTKGQRQEQQAVDTFDAPVGEAPYVSPYSHQPR